MFTKRIEILRLFGIPLRIDLSWLIIAILLAWSLATGVFPRYYSELSDPVYWSMGVIGVLGLFASIVLHELAHAKVAQRRGLSMKGITLFIFGGVAEMTEEPRDAKSEFLVAIAGPIASLIIATCCLGLEFAGRSTGLSVAVTGVLNYLWWINLVVVGFNLVPAFPLDGGRVLRSILWKLKGSLKWATRITSQIGAGFGLALVLLGVISVVGGNFIGGMWWFLIGLFLRGAAGMSYQQLLTRRALEGEAVSRFMEPDIRSVPSDITVQELIDDYVYRYHFKMFPVMENGRLLGCVTTRKIQEVPREEWSERKVADLADPCGEENVIHSDDDALKALSKMNRVGASRLMVVEDSQLRGIISLKDLLKFVSLKIELEETD